MSKPRVHIFGQGDPRALAQLNRCLRQATYGVLCADHHVGYSAPIGAAIAYPRHVSPSGVGYDIGCGNLAVRTPLRASTIDTSSAMDEIVHTISFGIGRINREAADDPVLEGVRKADFAPQRKLLKLAESQLGTVGAGNHYVDLFGDEQDRLWIGVHFGSRGFGHRTATGFLAMAEGQSFTDRPRTNSMDAPPVLLEVRSEMGQAYISAMRLAGAYARAGRRWVVQRTLQLLSTQADLTVHNHHNFAWEEKHFGQTFWVVRKGATPAFPGQQGFVGATMGGTSVILEGIDSPASAQALYSTVHGAGRVMSRRQAAGRRRYNRKRKQWVQTSPGVVDWPAVRASIRRQGIELRGGGADEAPEAYKNLDHVLAEHAGTVRVTHRLRPIGVAMAGADTFDPFRD